MKRAIIWFAWGGAPIKLVHNAARSVAQQMPDVPRLLITDAAGNDSVFTKVYRVRRGVGPAYYRKVRWLNYSLDFGYDQLLYLDADTWVCKPVHDIFDLLIHSTLVYAHTPFRHVRPTVPAVPEAFVEPNTAVMAYRVNDEIRELFHDWKLAFERLLRNGGKHNDQPVLRQILWGCDIKTMILPTEYNYRFAMLAPMREHIRILHGYHDDIETIARYLAIPWKYREHTAGVFLEEYEKWRKGE